MSPASPKWLWRRPDALEQTRCKLPGVISRVRRAHPLFSPAFFARWRRKAASPPRQEIGRKLDWRIPAHCEHLAAAWKNELDEYSVAKAALIASIPGDEDSVAAAVTLFPDRFWGFFMANPVAPDGVARVQTRWTAAACKASACFPRCIAIRLADPRVRPVFEAAAAHPGADRLRALRNAHGGRAAQAGPGFAVRHALFQSHRSACRRPGVSAREFRIPHFGAGYFREALMLCDLCPNVYLDTSSSNSWVRYQPERMDLKDVFRKALEVAGPGGCYSVRTRRSFRADGTRRSFRADRDALRYRDRGGPRQHDSGRQSAALVGALTSVWATVMRSVSIDCAWAVSRPIQSGHRLGRAGRPSRKRSAAVEGSVLQPGFVRRGPRLSSRVQAANRARAPAPSTRGWKVGRASAARAAVSCACQSADERARGETADHHRQSLKEA
jgi:uncharacterized protein